MGLPPSFGAVKLTVARALPAVAVTPVGSPGAVSERFFVKILISAVPSDHVSVMTMTVLSASITPLAVELEGVVITPSDESVKVAVLFFVEPSL
jgi:hypothetical protein